MPRHLVSAIVVGVAVVSGAWLHAQAPAAPARDRVAALRDALVQGTRTLTRDAHTGYLRPVLDALGVPEASQLLVFSKTGVQGAYASPKNPRALYFNESVMVGYNPGAPSLELAAHDPQQGVMFYTIDQAAAAPVITRRTTCLSCHVSPGTLGVPGLIDRSHMVDRDGRLAPQPETHEVDHRTPHTERWGGWYVTGNGAAPPYNPFGHLGNMTVAVRETPGPAIVSDHVFLEWLGSEPETRGYLSAQSDLAALLTFNHETHAINLLTRLRVDAEAAAGTGWTRALQGRAEELADYLLFVGEAGPVAPLQARAGFAEHLEASTPKDRLGRSFGQLDLDTRLLRYPCSFMIYTDAFDALPPAAKTAVYRRMLAILSGTSAQPKYAHLSAGDRRAILEILRDTKHDLP